MDLKTVLENIEKNISAIKLESTVASARVTKITKSIIECQGIENFVQISQNAYLILSSGDSVLCEVIEVLKDRVLFLPFDECNGAKIGDKIILCDIANYINPDVSWKGRIIDSFGNPRDNLGKLKQGSKKYLLNGKAPNFEERKKVGKRMDLGTRAIDVFTPCCYGQRIGILGGSGMGKSSLISRLVKYSNVDVKVVGFIGERSREIKEFIHNYLSEEDRKNTVIIASSAEDSPLVKKRAAYVTMCIAEYFRDLGLEVLCMMDSITRFAMSQREISLNAGHVPVNKGYTASVFSALPKLLERAGPGRYNQGNITGIFSILVEGNDYDEPITDTVKSILDGHVVLDENIMQQNIFPPVNIPKSLSRSAPLCYENNEKIIVQTARSIIAKYKEMEDMIKIGIYKTGSNKETDFIIETYEKILSFLKQDINHSDKEKNSFHILGDIVKDYNNIRQDV